MGPLASFPPTHPQRVLPKTKKETKMAEEYVLTPGGFRPKSLVHAVEAGHVVHVEEGRIRTLDSHGKLVADHGPMVVQPGNGALHPHNVMKMAPGVAAKVPALGSGWITYAYWSNTTG